MWKFIPRTENSKNYDLNRNFLFRNWSEITSEKRMECLQELENRLALEQGRPAKTVIKEPLASGECGYWSKSKDMIVVNSNLVDDMCFMGAGMISYRSDASVLLYDTIAHEGFHAFQDYSLEHPEVCNDKERLEEWRINSATRIDLETGRLLRNYYDPNIPGNENKYRIQPLERDANDYAYSKTAAAFKELEEYEGSLKEFENYKEIKELNSYENALASEMQRDPQCIENMKEEMTRNYCEWNELKYEAYVSASADSGSICGNEEPLQSETSKPTQNDYQDNGVSEYERIKNTPEPYAHDNGDYVHTPIKRLSGSNIVYRPSLLEQYTTRMEGLYSEIEGRNLSQEEHEEYLEKIYNLQDELGYYPEFDPRMKEAYAEQMSGIDEIVNRALVQDDKEQLKRVREALKEYDTAQRDKLGYYPNRPEEHAQGCSPHAETMESYAESEGINRENTEVQIERETMDEYVGSEDFEHGSVEAQNKMETMEEYTANENYEPARGEHVDNSLNGISYSESGQSNSMQQG